MSQVDSDEIAVIISPERPPLDEPIDIRVTGLTPDEQVTLRVEMSWDDRTFASQATFNANAGGVVDLGETAPLAGSYDGVKKMGLFWSLAPVDEESERSELPARLPTTVTVEQDGDVMASAQFDRIGSEGVRRQEVDASGVPADLYLPQGEGPYPGVIFLGGSEGGRPRYPSLWLLAASGYAVFGPAYFGADESPTEALIEVPVETIESAVEWFATHDDVDEPLSIIGSSRGSELAFMLATRMDRIRAAIGYVPSGIAFEGQNENLRPAGTAAWSIDGTPVEYVPTDASLRTFFSYVWSFLSKRPVEVTGTYVDSIDTAEPERVAAASIPVEKTGGPVVLFGGRDDRLWASATLARRLRDRLLDNDYAHDVTLQTYPNTGHAIRVPYLPTTGRSIVGEGRFKYSQGRIPRVTAPGAECRHYHSTNIIK